MTCPSYLKIGETLREWRELKKLTQGQIAHAYGCKVQHISKVERCETAPTGELMALYIDMCDIPTAEFLAIMKFLHAEWTKQNVISKTKKSAQ